MSLIKKVFMIAFFVMSLFALSITVSADIPSNYSFYNIGTTKSLGSADYNSTTNTFTIKSTGLGITGFADRGLHYVYMSMKGNGSITARVTNLNSFCEGGLMLRSSLKDDASMARIVIKNGLLEFRRRAHIGVALNGCDVSIGSSILWFKITKEGFHVNTYYSFDGITFKYERIDIKMKLGIVGLPNVGKSTLFNAITKAGAECANYPFCTIEPNVGICYQGLHPCWHL